MATTIITPDDLEQFKWELLADIKEFLDKRREEDLEKNKNRSSSGVEMKKWLKSHQVQRLLGISPGTLQNLRINGTMPYSKIGGILFYDKEVIEKMLEDNTRNKPIP